MRIVSYNVNGLRARISQHGSLLKFLSSLHADIICIQETKLSRQEISADLFMAEGYEAFFSCTRTSKKGRISYSGVATFCHVDSAFSSRDVALPISAEEGFTGLLSLGGASMTRGSQQEVSLGGIKDITEEDLIEVDSEGRCVITDHGHFVLFNIYGPRAESHDTERLRFKHNFFKTLQKRWETLLCKGRRVFVVGDLNIAPAAIDHWNAGACWEENMFQKWLRSILRGCGGPFFDVFREKHPKRRDAYTCWAANSGTEEFDCGSRIDLILIAGQCLHENQDGQSHNFVDCHVKDCDILNEFKRWKPGTTPRGKGEKNIKLEGSDHAPVFVCLDEMPKLPVHSTPSLAARYIPEVRGWQQTIVPFLFKREATELMEQGGSSSAFEKSMDETYRENDIKGPSSPYISTNSRFTPSLEVLGLVPSAANDVAGVSGVTAKENSMTVSGKERKELTHWRTREKRKNAKCSSTSQLSLKCFFPLDHSRSSVQVANDNNNFPVPEVHKSEDTNFPEEIYNSDHIKTECPSQQVNDNELCAEQTCTNVSCSEELKSDPLLEWQRIQELMKTSIPLCKGHHEPCVARLVKKAGPNVGRGFYVCARAQGPASNPEANCGHFQWASTKSKRKRR